jgi:hypothetical protein
VITATTGFAAAPLLISPTTGMAQGRRVRVPSLPGSERQPMVFHQVSGLNSCSRLMKLLAAFVNSALIDLIYCEMFRKCSKISRHTCCSIGNDNLPQLKQPTLHRPPSCLEWIEGRSLRRWGGSGCSGNVPCTIYPCALKRHAPGNAVIKILLHFVRTMCTAPER